MQARLVQPILLRLLDLLGVLCLLDLRVGLRKALSACIRRKMRSESDTRWDSNQRGILVYHSFSDGRVRMERTVVTTGTSTCVSAYQGA